MSYEKPLKISHNKPMLADAVRALLVLVMAIAAALTVLTHISKICSIPFSVYAIIGVCISLAVAGTVLYSELSKPLLKAITEQPKLAAALFSLALFGSMLCLLSHRPDPDDGVYVSNVVYYLEHPAEPMGFEVHFIDSGREGESFLNFHGYSIPFEFSQGILAYITKTQMLSVYYLFAPAMFGCLIPLAWFYLISRFSFSTKAAITGSFFICLSLLLMGQQHRSFGNFAFNRIFQGKTVLLSIGIPLFTALTMDFFRSPNIRNWMYLLAASTTAIGFSITAAVLIPMLAFALAIACCFSYLKNTKSRLVLSCCYFSSLIYPALYAVSILLVSMEMVGTESVTNRSWPSTFLGHAKYVLNDKVALLFLVTGTIVAIMFQRKRDRLFLVIWIASVLVFYLNPLVSDIIINYVTSPNIYWRVFYLLPFPLVIGLTFAAIESRLEKKSQKLRHLIFGGLAIAFLIPHPFKPTCSVFQKTYIQMPCNRIKSSSLSHARQILSLSPPPGSMLAPEIISTTTTMLTSQYPQISFRPYSIMVFMEQHGRQTEGIRRMEASRYLAGDEIKPSRYVIKQISEDGVGIDSLIWTINNNPQIRSVVAYRKVAEANNKELFDVMEKLGFGEYKLTEHLILFIRPDQER